MSYTNQFIKKALDLNKSVNITIEGPCMSPLLKDGESVQVKKDKAYCKGDIILYEDGRGKLICHRINYTDENIVITSGDNNLLFDPPINYTDILGKVTVKPNYYQIPNPIISLDYKNYLSSEIDKIHTKIALLEKETKVSSNNEFRFFGSLPSKKQMLILIRGLNLTDLSKSPNLHLDGHVLI
ncbi:S24/S26 family peptidase [Bacillus mycoides]|uniref:S24/S26 family peptidase n=1 Tax=Bacillus cereus group TaxID=86661 RepID=UPI00237B0ED6|nr:S24/S26 family peptidase [Bacillus cereus]